MEKSKSVNPLIFKGVGYIVGAVIGIVAAITAFVLTQNIAISIPLFAGLSIPLGIGMEGKIQSEPKENEARTMKIMLILFATGVLFFLSIVFITQFI